jgi:hypothetical protein
VNACLPFANRLLPHLKLVGHLVLRKLEIFPKRPYALRVPHRVAATLLRGLGIFKLFMHPVALLMFFS